jgi:hypothetical protein
VRMEELGQLKNPMNSSGIEPATLGLVAQPIPNWAGITFVHSKRHPPSMAWIDRERDAVFSRAVGNTFSDSHLPRTKISAYASSAMGTRIRHRQLLTETVRSSLECTYICRFFREVAYTSYYSGSWSDYMASSTSA